MRQESSTPVKKVKKRREIPEIKATGQEPAQIDAQYSLHAFNQFADLIREEPRRLFRLQKSAEHFLKEYNAWLRENCGREIQEDRAFIIGLRLYFN